VLDGESLGYREGASLGLVDGLGEMVGTEEGASDGTSLGKSEGACEIVGAAVG